MEHTRSDKVASVVLRHVAGILSRGFAEGILGGVSLSGAEAHGGLQFVRLWYYVREGEDRNAVQSALDKVAPAVRRELGSIMNQKFVPDIRFAYDETLEKAKRLEEVLEKLK
ncbi:MAG: ribosome-binding factor A [Rickettsiales bacterium]|nr:ribosome-binding factor A [Rickettsiales bacterium]